MNQRDYRNRRESLTRGGRKSGREPEKQGIAAATVALDEKSPSPLPGFIGGNMGRGMISAGV